MTPAQRRLGTKWIFGALLLCLIFIFNDFLENNAEWLRWVAFAGVVIASLGQSRTRSEMRAEASADLSDLVESAPWLKIWLSIWAAVFFFGAIYVTRYSVDLLQVFGAFRFLIFSFAVLFGPIVVVIQRQRFKKLGENGDAI